MFLRHSLIVGATVLLGAINPLSTSATAQTVIGAAQKVVRQVAGTWQTRARTLQLQDDIYGSERISTAAESATRLIFRDKTMLSIGAESNVVLDRFVFDPDPNKSTVAISISRGVLRFVSGSLPKSRYSIRTPTASIGIRGTILEVIVAADGTTTVNVIEGSAVVTGGGSQQSVGTGFTVVTPPGGGPGAPTASAGTQRTVLTMNRLLGPDPGRALAQLPDGRGGVGLTRTQAGGLGALALGALIAVIADDNGSGASTSTSSASSTNY